MDTVSQSDFESSCDEASSSLGDSTYDFVDDRSVLTTDDERDLDDGVERGMSRASGSYPTPPAESGADDDFDVLSNTLKTPSCASNKLASLHNEAQPGGSPSEHDGTMTEKPVCQDLGSDMQSSTPSPYDGKGSAIIDKSCSHETELPYRRVPSVTQRQKMTTTSLDFHGKVFKILFVGPAAVKEAVTQKIGSALAASPVSTTPKPVSAHPSRFSVVPVSEFGDPRNPDVVLIGSSGLELDVQELCSMTEYRMARMGTEFTKLHFLDGSYAEYSNTDRKMMVSGKWNRPDLVVLWMPTDSSSKEVWSSPTVRSKILMVMRQSQVPVLVISEGVSLDPPTECTPTSDAKAPHLDLESQPTDRDQRGMGSWSPVDLDTFLKIDASQMNRDLACLLLPRREKEALYVTARKTTDLCSQYMQNILSSPKTVPMMLFLLAGMLFIYIAAVPDYIRTNHSADTSVVNASAASSLQLAPTTLQSMLLKVHPTVEFAVSTLPIAQSSTDLPKNTDLASFLSYPYAATPDRMDRFEARILGDHHIILRPPYWFTKSKKAAPLTLKVSCEGRPLQHQVLTLFEGVQALQIPREEAHGSVAIQISIHGKSFVNETVMVHFDSPWFNLAGGRRMINTMTQCIQPNFSLLKTSLSAVYHQSTEELLKFADQTQTRAVTRVLDGQAALAARVSKLSETHNVLITQTAELSCMLSTRIRAAQKLTSRSMHSLAKRLTSSARHHTDNQRRVLSHSARMLTHAATGVDVKKLGLEIRNLQARHLRRTQVWALKAWWATRAVPRREADCVQHRRL